MMVATVISDSDSDSEFERDVQEATRWLLITVAPSPVREVISYSIDNEEKVAIKRLLSFPNRAVEVGESQKVSVQSIQLDSSHNTNYVRNAYQVPTHLPCRFLRTSLSFGKATVTVTVHALKGTNVHIMCMICKTHYLHTNCVVANFAFISILHPILP